MHVKASRFTCRANIFDRAPGFSGMQRLTGYSQRRAAAR